MINGIIFVNSALYICCDPSSESSRRDGSDEGSQHMVSMKTKKNDHKLLLI